MSEPMTFCPVCSALRPSPRYPLCPPCARAVAVNADRKARASKEKS